MEKNTKMIIAAMALAVLLIAPASIVGAGSWEANDLPTVTAQDSDTDEGVTFERLDPSEIDESIDLDSLVTTRSMDNGAGMSMHGRETYPLDDVTSQRLGSLKDRNLFIPKGMEIERPTDTRASDKDNNDDLGNGSVLNPTPKESVDGQLFADSLNLQNDIVDWYKLQIPQGQVNPSGSGSTQNYTVRITSFTSPDIELIEPSYEIVPGNPPTTNWFTDYIDTLEIWIFYIHYSWHGLVDMGGSEIMYDNQKDSDGWTWDSNWSASFRPVVDSQGTTEDTNGYTNTLTERGWYYIAVRYLYFTTADGVPPRSESYFIDYTLEVERTSSNEPNNYPFTTSYASGAGNDWKNATTTAPTARGSARVDTDYNNVDWYKWKSPDSSKLANMTFNVTINNYNFDGGHIGYWEDIWIYTMVVYYSWGEDMKWGTSDDNWEGLFTTFSWQLGPNQGFRSLFNNQNKFSYFVHSNYTNPPSGVVPDNMDPRNVYLAIWAESINLGVNAQNQLFLAPATSRWWADYQIDWHVNERTVNTKPVLSEIEVTTDNPPEVYIYSPVGGYYETEFKIEVTYTDAENYEPEGVWLVFDKGTARERSPIDITDNRVDPSDLIYTDGVDFYYETTGEVLTNNPSTHTIAIYAIDAVAPRDIRKAIMSDYSYENESLVVWDDNPVKLVKTWAGLPVLNEDDKDIRIPLDGFEGAFDDPEKQFKGFNIWDPMNKAWSYDVDIMNPDDEEMTLLNVNITKDRGSWEALLTLSPNVYYTAGVPLTFRGYDRYSEINRTSRLIINPVNDPPLVTSVKVGTTEYPADNTQPLAPIVHLEDKLTFKEDELIEFSIIAEDQGGEGAALEYSYEPTPSSQWEGETMPQVDMTTGIVTYTPNNDDVSKPIPNNKMAFTIDDRGADGDITLIVYLKVENVNDKPVLTIPAGTRSFQQFGELRVKPQGTDDDKGDALTYDVNFEEEIGDTPSVLDQLPFVTGLQKTIDWDLNENTGEFWFKLDDQNIWKTSAGNQKTVTITVAFKVSDRVGQSDTKTVSFDLTDVNQAPLTPTKVTSDPAERQEVGKEVKFTVDPVTDPDGDKLFYKWNFGDGFTGEGQNVTHIYRLTGIKQVEVWVEDGQFQTDKYPYRIEIIPEPITDDDDDDDDTDTDTDTDKQSDGSMTIIIIAIIIIVALVVVVVLALVVLRKRPAPPAAQYPYDPALMGYSYQGLPPAQPGQLPPGQTPELPPAPDYAGTELPPVAPEQQPVVPPAAQAPGPQPAAPAAPEQMGNACPSCGAPVDPSWFLCPNCKAPLQ